MIIGFIITAALLVYLIAIPRHLKPVAAILAAVWAVTAVLVFYDHLKSNERQDNIVSTAVIDASCEDPRAPLKVSFENRNDVPVRKLTYKIEAFEPAFRVSVVVEPYQISEVEVAAGATYSACRAFRMRNGEKSDPAKLDWKVSILSAQF